MKGPHSDRVGSRPDPRVRWEGDRALRVGWGPEPGVPALRADVSVWYAARLSRTLLAELADRPEVLDVVTSLEAVTVLLTADAPADGGLALRVRSIARAVAAGVGPETPDTGGADRGNGGRLVRIPVRYGGADGPDLAAVAERSGFCAGALVARHTGRTYVCFAVGFRPGMPFLGPLDDAIVAPRLDRPRLEVPAGSVAVAGRQTGIYPVTSPGGWQLIGRTAAVLFDPSRPDASRACLVHPGDRVRFEASPEGAVMPG